MKNKTTFRCIVISLMVSIISCDVNDINGIISRNAPFSDTVTAEGLNEGVTVSLKWAADEGADSYILQKSIQGENGIGALQEIFSGVETSYIDNNIDVGTSYVYRLDKKRGNKIFAGKEYTIFNRTRNDPFPDVVSAEGLNEGKKVLLKWAADKGADSYILIRSIDGKDGTKEIYSGIGTSYIDEDIDTSISYIYRLDKKRGNKVIEGTDIVRYNRTRNDPFQGVITAANLGAGKVRLHWEADAGADNYIIQKWTLANYGGGAEFPSIDNGNQTEYIDTEIDPRTSYVYRLDKKRGDVTVEGKILIFEKTRNDPFQGVITATSLNGGEKAHLIWAPDAGADEYRIRRAENGGADIAWVPISVTNEIYFTDSGLDDTKSYLYRLDKRCDDHWIEGINICVFSTTRPMPFEEAPRADSFREDHKIILTWTHDVGADEYILARRKDSAYGWGEYEVIYQGSAVTYEDSPSTTLTNLYEYDRYEYRLSKRRNTEVITPAGCTTLAVAVWVRKDVYESNDGAARATELESPRSANLYCFRFSDNRVLEDIDWYKIDIPSGQKAQISVTYGGGADDRMILLAGNGMSSTSMTNSMPYQIINNTGIKQYIAFELMPSQTEIVPWDTPGGRIINYTITWVATTP